MDLNKYEQQQLVKKIQKAQATFIKRQSNRVTLFDVEYKEKILRVVYDSVRKSIVTVLPQLCSST